MEERGLRLLRNAVVVALAASFVAGIFVPVYTDEVGWRFQERAAIDGVDKLFNDICGANTLAAPPLFMMPARYFSAYLNLWFADPFYVRVSGIVYALAWLAMLLVLIGRITSGQRERTVLGLFAVGLMGLAVTPVVLVISRPEQPILLTATAALLLAFADPPRAEGRPDTAPRSSWWRSLAILFLASVALSYHAKALILVPLFLACIYLASRGRAALLPRWAAGSLLVVFAAMAFCYWSGRLACPDDPVLRAAYDGQNFGTSLSGIDSLPKLLALIGALVGNINLWDYGLSALPQPRPMSAWLPNDQIDSAGTTRWGIIYFFCWGAVALYAIACLLVGLRNALVERRLDPRPVISVLLLALMIAWSATQGQRNFYESIWVLPLLMLSAVFAMSYVRMPDGAIKIRNVFAALLGLGAIASMALTARLWAPALMRSNAQTAYIAEQPYSVPVFGYAQEKADILGAARLCGIVDPPRRKGLLVDDVTYFAFMESRRPQHRLGAFSVWNGTIDDPVAYLKSRGSDGMIVGCRLLPPELRQRAKRQGQFCCLGPPDW